MLLGKNKKSKTQQQSIVAIEVDPSRKENQPQKRRKPQDRSKLTRNSQVQIRLTEVEVATLKAAAKESDMTLADFVMSGVHQRRRIVVPGAGELRSELIRVGNNLNQALRLAHTLRKEGQLIDAVSIELSADRAEDALEKLNSWLAMWDVYLAYQNKKGEE